MPTLCVSVIIYTLDVYKMSKFQRTNINLTLLFSIRNGYYIIGKKRFVQYFAHFIAN